MANFDQNNFNIRPGHAQSPWDSPAPERRDVDAPVRKSIFRIPIVRILAIILLISLALCCIYTLFVHPIHRLNLKLRQAEYYEVRIVTRYSYWENSTYKSGTDYATVKVYVDQNAFVYSSGPADDDAYYKVVDGVLYKYDRWFEEWETASEHEQATYSLYAGVFDRRNYKYAKDRLFAWRYQDSKLYFKGTFGNFKFIHEGSEGTSTMKFACIERDPRTLPWEE